MCSYFVDSILYTVASEEVKVALEKDLECADPELEQAAAAIQENERKEDGRS